MAQPDPFGLPPPPLFRQSRAPRTSPDVHYSVAEECCDLWVADLDQTSALAVSQVRDAERYVLRLTHLAASPIPHIGAESSAAPATAFSVAPEEEIRIAAARGFLMQLARRLAQFARIETRTHGHLVAVTEVDLGGDTRNYLTPQADSHYIMMHSRNVQTVMNNRAALYRILSRTTSMLLRIVTTSTTGVGLVSAWRAVITWLITIDQNLAVSEHTTTSP
ncbi:MAG: hypothetical protein HUU55_15740 [Myxococcales bacterium]|nr:hypothetical protein [Myxococcales bacterium]